MFVMNCYIVWDGNCTTSAYINIPVELLCNIYGCCCSERKNVNLLVNVYRLSHGKVPCIFGFTDSILSEKTTIILCVKSHKSADLIYAAAEA
jgi:hypothetical protein